MSDGFKMVDDREGKKKEIEKIVLEDVIVIGNSEPDELSDGRKSICTVGYHPKVGLIRIYPVPPDANMNRWNKVTIPLERNPQDTRIESWKVQGSKEKQLSDKIKVTGKLTREESIELLKKLKSEFSYGCVEEINEKKLSLGFIKPVRCASRFEQRDKHEVTVQKNLLTNQPFLTIRNFEVQPRMTYQCPACKTEKGEHDQQILEWGIYEGIRKKPDIKEKILDGLHINDPEYEIDLLVGNQARYRKSFMVISVYRFKK